MPSLTSSAVVAAADPTAGAGQFWHAANAREPHAHAAIRAVPATQSVARCDHEQVGKHRDHSQTFADIIGELPPPVGEPDPDAGEWPSPIRDGEWFDPTGRRWPLRVLDLDVRQARRIMTRPGSRALHCYGMHPKEISGAELEALLARIDNFFDGQAPPMSHFWLAEFRDDERATMLVIEEGC